MVKVVTRDTQVYVQHSRAKHQHRYRVVQVRQVRAKHAPGADRPENVRYLHSRVGTGGKVAQTHPPRPPYDDKKWESIITVMIDSCVAFMWPRLIGWVRSDFAHRPDLTREELERS